MKFTTLAASAGAFFATVTTGFAQFNGNNAAKKTPVASGQKEIVINTRDEAYQPWGLKMKKGDTLAIDLSVFNSNQAVFGPTVGPGGVCGVSALFTDAYKEVQGFKLAETLITIKDENNHQEIVSLCDAVHAAPKSEDGKKSYLVVDNNCTILNAFVNDGRQFVSNMFAGRKRGIDDNNGKITIAYQHLKHK